MYNIIRKKQLNEVVYEMEIHAPFVAKKAMPGQFIILRVDESGERTPFTIMDYNRETGTITIVFQTLGLTTKKLAKKEVGEAILDFVGPLGKPAEFKKNLLQKGNRVLGVAGGVGAAPLYPQLRYLKEQGIEVDVIIGGRSEQYLLLREYFENICSNVYYATNDGSVGTKGFVTDVLVNRINEGEIYDKVIAIGPLIMMKAVVGVTKPLDIPTNVSLNPIMVDGTGMCGGCRVTVDHKVKFACVDGPDFDGFLVDFDECINRQNYYKEDETHICKMEETIHEK